MIINDFVVDTKGFKNLWCLFQVLASFEVKNRTRQSPDPKGLQDLWGLLNL